MNNLNVNQFYGNLVRDPEVVVTKTGKKLLKFSIAYTTQGTTDSEGSHANYIDVQAWEKTAELYQYLTKGKAVIVKGELIQNRWKDTEGKARSKFLLNADTIIERAYAPKAESAEQPA